MFADLKKKNAGRYNVKPDVKPLEDFILENDASSPSFNVCCPNIVQAESGSESIASEKTYVNVACCDIGVHCGSLSSELMTSASSNIALLLPEASEISRQDIEYPLVSGTSMILYKDDFPTDGPLNSVTVTKWAPWSFEGIDEYRVAPAIFAIDSLLQNEVNRMYAFND